MVKMKFATSYEEMTQAGNYTIFDLELPKLESEGLSSQLPRLRMAGLPVY